jgi:factor associated with neutral sphingomyelinase activation
LVKLLLALLEPPPAAAGIKGDDSGAQSSLFGLAVNGTDGPGVGLLGLDEDHFVDDESPTPLPPGVWNKKAAEAMEAAAEAAEATAAAEAAFISAEIDVGGPDSDTGGLRQLWIARNHLVDVRGAAFIPAGRLVTAKGGGGGAGGDGSGGHVVTVGRDSLVKVFSATDGRQMHSSMVGSIGKVPLSCLALLYPSHSSCTATATATGTANTTALPTAASNDTPGDPRMPTILAGSYDNSVYGYNADHGRVLGRLAAHDDAVSALCVPALDSTRLFTGSWDGSVRLWDISRGGGGWSSSSERAGAGAEVVDVGAAVTFGSSLDGVSRGGEPAGWVVTAPTDRDERPLAETSDMTGEVWSLCCDPGGSLAVIGGDDGECAAWDPRYRHVSWKSAVCPSGRGVTSLALMPCRTRVAAACADGFVRLIELRMGGDVSAEADMGTGALTCVVANGARGVLAGGKDGRVVAWNPDAPATYPHGGAYTDGDLPGPGHRPGHPSGSSNGVRRDRPYTVRGVAAPPGGGLSCLSVAPDGGAIVVGWGDGSVGVYVEATARVGR